MLEIFGFLYLFRTYGPSDIVWEGSLNDGKSRGGHPYYCPKGWKKYALLVPHCESAKVCFDSYFRNRVSSEIFFRNLMKDMMIGVFFIMAHSKLMLTLFYKLVCS